MVTFSVLVHVA